MEWGRKKSSAPQPKSGGLAINGQEQLAESIIDKLTTFQVNMEQRVMDVINTDRGSPVVRYQTVCDQMDFAQQLNNRVLIDQRQLRYEMNAAFGDLHGQQSRMEHEMSRMQTDQQIRERMYGKESMLDATQIKWERNPDDQSMSTESMKNTHPDDSVPSLAFPQNPVHPTTTEPRTSVDDSPVFLL